jgi:DNA-binding NtrC family response regulator
MMQHLSNPPMFVSKSTSILVVDDDDSVRSVIHACLDGAGYQVVSAAGREPVMSLLSTRRFDLVITDVLMPEFDGTEVVAAAKKHQPHAAIIAMSGGGPALTGEFCLALANRLGAGTPLLKPFHLDQLLKAVENALGRGKCEAN